jgi:predicted ATPase
MIKSKKLYCFTGASGVGKTTLLNEISKWEDFEVSELSARPYLPKIGTYVENSSDDIQTLINYGTMVTMMDKVLNSDTANLFFSRCGIDRLAYSKVLDVGSKLSQITVDDIIKNLQNVTVFYLPIEFDLPDDDLLRGNDEAVRCKTDEAIYHILQAFKIPHITVSGTVEERLQTIKNNLQ